MPLRFVSKQGKAQGIRTVEILRTTVSKTVQPVEKGSTELIATTNRA